MSHIQDKDTFAWLTSDFCLNAQTLTIPFSQEQSLALSNQTLSAPVATTKAADVPPQLPSLKAGNDVQQAGSPEPISVKAGNGNVSGTVRGRKGGCNRKCSAVDCTLDVPNRSTGKYGLCVLHRRHRHGVAIEGHDSLVGWCTYCTAVHDLSEFVESLTSLRRRVSFCSKARARQTDTGRDKRVKREKRPKTGNAGIPENDDANKNGKRVLENGDSLSSPKISRSQPESLETLTLTTSDTEYNINVGSNALPLSKLSNPSQGFPTPLPPFPAGLYAPPSVDMDVTAGQPEPDQANVAATPESHFGPQYLSLRAELSVDTGPEAAATYPIWNLMQGGAAAPSLKLHFL